MVLWLTLQYFYGSGLGSRMWLKLAGDWVGAGWSETAILTSPVPQLGWLEHLGWLSHSNHVAFHPPGG